MVKRKKGDIEARWEKCGEKRSSNQKGEKEAERFER